MAAVQNVSEITVVVGPGGAAEPWLPIGVAAVWAPSETKVIASEALLTSEALDPLIALGTFVVTDATAEPPKASTPAQGLSTVGSSLPKTVINVESPVSSINIPLVAGKTYRLSWLLTLESGELQDGIIFSFNNDNSAVYNGASNISSSNGNVDSGSCSSGTILDYANNYSGLGGATFTADMVVTTYPTTGASISGIQWDGRNTITGAGSWSGAAAATSLQLVLENSFTVTGRVVLQEI